MIKVILRGALGNQMFQYAAGLSLALDKGTELILDTTYSQDRLPRPGVVFRNYGLDVFVVESKFGTLSALSKKCPIPGVWTGLSLAEMLLQKLFRTRHQTLWGFYQSEKYFAAHRDAVRAAFRFREPLVGEARRIADDIVALNARPDAAAVSLHVRRSDYINFAVNQKLFGGKTDTDYYDRAIRHISQRVALPHFYILSDDIAWCREHIKPPFPATYLDAATAGPKDGFHLQLMSLCKHNIIANSSFSWWGAWLNAHPDKMVIAPKRWYAERQDDDIVPEAWVRL